MITVTIPLPRPQAEAWQSLTEAEKAEVTAVGQAAIDAAMGVVFGRAS